ncbi:ABC transporter substrate-binding protein [uncultured Vibrio sp.]|uniref:substrate-binding periplasmic protein n=1 Tax=uncultured Vibrio sp. TaxID=114054 RepID=UPI0025E7771B|nr:transporter substrate-binding domain-containing protein [uncultured Vibrio sp.]
MKIIVSTLLFLTGFVNASSNDQLDVIVGVSDGYPIYYYNADTQSFQGPMIDTFRVICAEAEINCTFRALPKKRIEKELISGTIHFGSVINSDSQMKQLEGSVYYTQFNIPASIGIYSTLPEEQIPTQLEDYYGESIICVLGWTLSIFPGVWEAEQQEKVRVYQSSSIEAATQMLLTGRSKFLYSNKEKMDVFFTEQDAVHFKQFRSYNQTFALSKTSKNFEAIKKRVDKAISTLIDKGSIDNKTGRLK